MHPHPPEARNALYAWVKSHDILLICHRGGYVSYPPFDMGGVLL